MTKIQAGIMLAALGFIGGSLFAISMSIKQISDEYHSELVRQSFERAHAEKKP